MAGFHVMSMPPAVACVLTFMSVPAVAVLGCAVAVSHPVQSPLRFPAEARTRTWYVQPSAAHRVSQRLLFTDPGEKLNGAPPLML